jgi:hypothetical protein
LTYVVQPIGRSSDTDTLGTHTKREDLGDDNPGHRSPGVTEVNGVEPDEDDGDPTSSPVVRPVVAVSTDNTGYDEMGDSHPNTTSNEDNLSSEAIDVEHCRDGGEEHDDTDNTSSKERRGATAQAKALEDERCYNGLG